MKKVLLFIFLAVSLVVTSNTLSAQSMYFCESVDGDGYPIGESTTFNIGSNGGYLDVLIRLPYSLNCTSVRYEIYKVDSYGNETYDNTIYQDTERDWVWFWKEVTFYKNGTYSIYCYDCSNYLLASNTIRINYR